MIMVNTLFLYWVAVLAIFVEAVNVEFTTVFRRERNFLFSISLRKPNRCIFDEHMNMIHYEQIETKPFLFLVLHNRFEQSC